MKSDSADGNMGGRERVGQNKKQIAEGVKMDETMGEKEEQEG